MFVLIREEDLQLSKRGEEAAAWTESRWLLTALEKVDRVRTVANITAG